MLPPQRGLPSVTQQQTDTKKDLEGQLKIACNVFIDSITQKTCAPMLAFLQAAAALQEDPAAHLGAAPFAAPPKLLALAAGVRAALSDAVMAPIRDKMALYLANPVTQRILLKPVAANLNEALINFRAIVESHFDGAENIGAVRTEVAQAQELAAALAV